MAGYDHTREHLVDELARIDQLVRAQVLRWRLTLAETKPERLWGMVHVTEQEVDAFLRSPFQGFDELAPELEATLRPYWERAAADARRIASRLEETEAGRSRLSVLVGRFGLSALERDILLMALLPAVDERYRRLFGYLQDDCSRVTPSVGLIGQVLQPRARFGAVTAALTARGSLRARRLVELEPAELKPTALRGVLVDPRIGAFLCGHDDVDERLDGIVEAPGGEAMAPVSWKSLAPLLAWLRSRDAAELAPVCLLEGPPGGRRDAARALAAAVGARLLVADVAAAIASPLSWPEVVQRVHREAALGGHWVAWRGWDALESDGERRVLIAAARDAAEGTVLIGERPLRDAGALLYGRPVVRLAAHEHGPEHRAQMWSDTLGGVAQAGDGVVAGDLALLAAHLGGLYRLSPSQIRAAVVTAGAAARARDPLHPSMTAEDLAAGCRAQTAVEAAGIAERVQPNADLTLRVLVLPPSVMSQIDELGRRIQARHAVAAALGAAAGRAGRGVTAMFSGPSGCGKTLAAEALASEQGVDLYRVDLSSVVSKYVGETEKNLARVFAELQDSNGILFFDEADALFGKRGEVVDARDRWANTEVNYLLQTLERYEGVVVLATNLRQNIDSAFARRIQVVIEFPFPDATARLELWRAALRRLPSPSEAELEAVSQRFSLTGGSIANVSLDAAFRALSEPAGGEPIVTVAHLAGAIAAEYRRLGKPITRGEFGDLYEAATGAAVARL